VLSGAGGLLARPTPLLIWRGKRSCSRPIGAGQDRHSFCAEGHSTPFNTFDRFPVVEPDVVNGYLFAPRCAGRVIPSSIDRLPHCLNWLHTEPSPVSRYRGGTAGSVGLSSRRRSAANSGPEPPMLRNASTFTSVTRPPDDGLASWRTDGRPELVSRIRVQRSSFALRLISAADCVMTNAPRYCRQAYDQCAEIVGPAQRKTFSPIFSQACSLRFRHSRTGARCVGGAT
jgi:hypothetical protein